MAYTLVVDGAPDDKFEWLDQLLSDAAFDDMRPDVPVIDGVVWDPESWGTTPQAQDALARAIAASGPPADVT